MLQFSEAWVAALVLCWARIGALIAFSPLPSATKAPAIFWVLFSLALAGLLSAAWGLRAPAAVTGFGGLVLALLGEVLLGALLGWAMHCIFAAFALAGRLLDVQMGLGLGSVFDPVTRSNAPVLGVVLALFGMALFFAADVHHLMLRGLAYSFEAVPPGGAWALPAPQLLLRPVAALFTAGVAVAAPVLFLLLMLELVLAFASRVLPQMNVLFVGIPAKVFVGLSMLALAAQPVGQAMRRSFTSIFDFWRLALP